MSVQTLIRQFKMALQRHKFESPICIEVGEETARALNDECRMVLKYSFKNKLKSNEMMLWGIRIVAPRTFVFTREKPSPWDFVEKP